MKIKGVRPKIGVDLHTLEGLHQGSRTHCFELFRRVISLTPEIDYVFFADTNRWNARNADVFNASNAQVIHMHHMNSVVRLLFQMPLLAAQHEIDLLHTQYICPFLINAKTAVTIHDILFEDFPQYFSRFMRARSKLLFRVSALVSELIFTVSDYSNEELQRKYSIPRNRIVTLYNAADAERFHPGEDGSEIIHNLGLIPGGYLLTVGRLEPRKNHLGLLRAMAMLKTPRPKLLIVGQRDFDYEAIFKLREDLHLQEDVMFLESADDSTLSAIYRNALIFVYPTFAEGFGMPVIEAMASGVPVVTSNTTSLPEIAGDAAILISPNEPSSIRDAIEKIMLDENLAALMRERGLERSQVFVWNDSADALARTYRAHFSGAHLQQ